MADSESPSEEAGKVKAPEPAPERRLPLLARGGLTVGLFAVALGASTLYRNTLDDQGGSEPPKNMLRKIDVVGSPVEHLSRGDAALERHLYNKALSHYEELLGVQPEAAALVEYRVGLCNESLGQAAKAIAAYRKAIQGARTAALSVAAHLGTARCLLKQNETGEARRLLYPLFFDEGRRRGLSPSYLADARYIVALAFARELKTSSQPDDAALTPGAAEDLVSLNPSVLDMPFYLEEVALAGKPAKPTKETEETPKSTNLQGPQLPLATVKSSGPVPEVLNELAQQAGLRVTLSPDAQRALGESVFDISVKNESAADLIAEAADEFNLVFTVDHDGIHLRTLAESDAKTIAQGRHEQAIRALYAALKANGSHAWAPAARLEMGNAEASQGKLREAAPWYQMLLVEGRDSRWVGEAYYNLGVLSVRRHDFGAARKAFVRVIDNAPAGDLALRARLRMGQIFLEEDNAAEAIAQLRRGETLAPQSRHQALIALNLATAYLRQRQPDAARLVLAKERKRLQQAALKSCALFLDSFAQFQLAKSEGMARREAGALLHNLAHEQDLLLLGSVGQGLVAQAYADMGLWDQTERVLRRSPLEGLGALRSWLDFLLADALLQQNREPDGMALLQKLAEAPSAYRGQARVRLARLDVEHKRFRDAMSKCAQLWAESPLTDPSEVLHVWGSALEGAGDFEKAAQCFAGKAPQ